ncbi:hypothetical protein GCM10010243_32820 [Streptomyces matensis]|nr:hypothetical protein GCM10010243_32820 [Streptomyces matensis]
MPGRESMSVMSRSNPTVGVVLPDGVGGVGGVALAMWAIVRHDPAGPPWPIAQSPAPLRDAAAAAPRRRRVQTVPG